MAHAATSTTHIFTLIARVLTTVGVASDDLRR